mmetsp:Transcript_5830/g.8977  ORF Transcript_5830/g.8977 Transcript_5830/m.8977 type:complete len:382 (-) Transcript_5830:168-1313(-)
MRRDLTSEFYHIVGERRARISASSRTSSKSLKTSKRSLFTTYSIDIIEKLRALYTGLNQYRQICIDTRRRLWFTDPGSAGAAAVAEREAIDALENETRLLLSQCVLLVENLKRLLEEGVDEEISDETPDRKERVGYIGSIYKLLGKRKRVLNEDTKAHRYGVVLFLNERIQTISQRFDRIRSVRLEKSMQSMRRLVSLDVLAARFDRERKDLLTPKQATPSPIPSLSSAPPSSSSSSSTHLVNGDAHSSLVDESPLKMPRRSPSPHQPLVDGDAPSGSQVVLESENQALHHELNCMVDQMREAEGRIFEISALQNMFSVEISRQAKDIERLFDQAVASLWSVQEGNKQLVKATGRGLDLRLFVLLWIFVATATLLFLDWYS